MTKKAILLACFAVPILPVFGLSSDRVIAEPTSRPVTTQPGAAANETVNPLSRKMPLHDSSSDKGDLTQLSLEDLMNVEVTSVAKQKQRIGDAPAAITVIGQDDIKRSGLASIPELLRLAPGMDVAQINANQWAISTRGFNGQIANDLLVLVDGRSVYSPAFVGVLWSGIDYPLADLDRIEVIRGPGATLWGSNAVNGVVNITTKSADQTQGWMLDTRAGTEASDTSLRYGGHLDDLTAYRVYMKSRYTDNSETALGDEANDRWSSLQGGFRIDRYGSPKDTLTLQGDSYSQEFDGTEAHPFGPINNVGHLDGQNILARWTHHEADQAETSLQVYYNRLKSDSMPVGFVENTVDVDFQNRFTLGESHALTWGLGARTSWATFDPNQTGVTISTESQTQSMVTGFVQDRITLVPDRLQWYLGTKLEYDDYGGFDVQPGTRLLWTPDHKHTVWAAVSRALRSPSLYEKTDLAVAPFGSLASDHLDDETSIAYEIGYKTKLSSTLTADVTAFATSYRDLIQQDVTLGRTLNGATAETYGAELSANWQVSPQWRLAGSYTLLETFVHEDNLGTERSPREVHSPQNQFQLHSYLDITSTLQFNTSLYFVQGMPSAGGGGFALESVPAYTRVDISVAWHPSENITLTAGIQNLLDDRHPESTTDAFLAAPTETQRAAFVQFNIDF